MAAPRSSVSMNPVASTVPAPMPGWWFSWRDARVGLELEVMVNAFTLHPDSRSVALVIVE